MKMISFGVLSMEEEQRVLTMIEGEATGFHSIEKSLNLARMAALRSFALARLDVQTTTMPWESSIVFVVCTCVWYSVQRVFFDVFCL